MTTTPPHRRTALITAGCVIAVVLAGAFAVSANIGILDASGDADIGNLSAAGDLLPTRSLDDTTAPATELTRDRGSSPSGVPTPAPQTYAVAVAGTVSITTSGDDLVLTGVVANPGWTWTQVSSANETVRLMFTDGTHSVLFEATRAADGTFDATVGESTPTTGSTTAPPVDDHEQHEHEGWDDDD